LTEKVRLISQTTLMAIWKINDKLMWHLERKGHRRIVLDERNLSPARGSSLSLTGFGLPTNINGQIPSPENKIFILAILHYKLRRRPAQVQAWPNSSSGTVMVETFWPKIAWLFLSPA